MPAPRAESERDHTENAFTAILRRLYGTVPALMAAILVDVEGECIDVVTALDPYEAKVVAAHTHMLIELLRRLPLRARIGDTHAFEVTTDARDIWVRRVGEDYVLVVILAHGFDRLELRDALAQAGREFRAEVGISTPSWEGREALAVRLRTSQTWHYAPEGFSVAGERFTIAAVLGRWVDTVQSADAPQRAVVCFRVRTQQGQELTLAHDERTEAWHIRE